MRAVKMVVTGEGGVGKTCMLISYTTNAFPGEYIPTVFDNYSANLVFDGKSINLGLWDTAYRSEEGFEKLFPLSLPQTDVLLLVFNIVNPNSLKSLSTRWMPIFKVHAPKVPMLLVGNKLDLRDDEEAIERLNAKGMHPVTTQEAEEAMRLFRKDGFPVMDYMECSALTQVGLKDVFERGSLLAWEDQDRIENGGKTPAKGGKDKEKCLLM